jgi:hypothetical protein
MNAVEIAKAAEASAAPFKAVLAPEILRAVKLAYVAQWLANQDDSTNSNVLVMRAQDAVHYINTGATA